MSEVAEQVAVASPNTEKKVVKKVPAAKKPKTKPKHPPTSEMVDAAIGALKERGGSSLLAIKKYVAATYKVDVEKLAPFLKKYIKGAVVKGHLLQTKGKGASGSFKLSTKAPAKKVAVAIPKSDKKTVAAKPKAAKKPTGEKKKVAVDKKPAVVKAKVVAAKKTVKSKPAPASGSKPKKAVSSPKKAAVKAKKPAAKKVSAKK